MPRNKQSRDVFQHDVIGLFKITGEQPKRNSRGSLAWDCECVAAGHPTTIEHAVLVYAATPTQCVACIEAEATARAADKVNEKRIVKEAAMEMLEKMQQEKQQSVQIAEPGKLGQTRVLIIPAPEVKESEASNV